MLTNWKLSYPLWSFLRHWPTAAVQLLSLIAYWWFTSMSNTVSPMAKFWRRKVKMAETVKHTDKQTHTNILTHTHIKRQSYIFTWTHIQTYTVSESSQGFHPFFKQFHSFIVPLFRHTHTNTDTHVRTHTHTHTHTHTPCVFLNSYYRRQMQRRWRQKARIGVTEVGRLKIRQQRKVAE